MAKMQYAAFYTLPKSGALPRLVQKFYFSVNHTIHIGYETTESVWGANMTPDKETQISHKEPRHY